MRFLVTLIAATVGTFVVTWLFARIALHFSGVPKGFSPFTTLPLLSGVVGGFVGASAGYDPVMDSPQF